MTKDTEYNGWPNYETWNVMLWMNSEEPAYRYYRLRAEQMKIRAANAKEIVRECFGDQTPDGVRLDDRRIRWGAVAAAMREN